MTDDQIVNIYIVLMFVCHQLFMVLHVIVSDGCSGIGLMLHLLKVERLISYIVVDHEDALSSVLVLLEPLPVSGAFDAARQVCERIHNVNGPPTLRQVRPAVLISCVARCSII